MILPFSVMLTFIGTIFVASYMGLVLNKNLNLDLRIAQSKAKYNAESGIALTYTTLASGDWGGTGSDLIDTETFHSEPRQIEGMGFTRILRLEESTNQLNKYQERESFAEGRSTVKNIWGESIIFRDTVSMKFQLESLSEFMYLTNHENAGGAPGIFGTNGSIDPQHRGKPCFGGNDQLSGSQGHVQTLDPMLICAGWPTPSFSTMVYITKADEEFVNSEYNSTGVNVGDPILPDFSQCGCDADDIFLGEGGPPEHPGYKIMEKVCFPIAGYSTTIAGASSEATHDATEMLHLSNQSNPDAMLKDTLIMTDIEFLSSGGYRVKRWWYLLPPYLRKDILRCPVGDCVNCTGTPNVDADCNDDGYPDYLYSHPQHLEGMPTDNNDIQDLCNGNNGNNDPWDYKEFPNVGSGDWIGDITQCEVYTESLNDFHSLLMNDNCHPNCLGNGICMPPVPWICSEQESYQFNVNYGNYTYSQHPGGGSTRLSHFDVEEIPDYFKDKGWVNQPSWSFGEENQIQNEVITLPGNEGVIHVKGGPVRVHGVYNGRYTLVTSGYDAINPENNNVNLSGNSIYGGWATYRRHAWYNSASTFGGAPIDTIRSNIWIIGDLVNQQAGSFGGPPQPNLDPDGDGENNCPYEKVGDCDASDFVLGLVSSSNVIIANSFENRTGGIDIHASIVGLNESFVMHYWQHALNDPQNIYDTPPQADNRGISIFGNDGNENRGFIRLWGGIIQEYRGYMKRNATGPYNSGDIGMDKDYNFDYNLLFPPPFFPSTEDCPVDGYNTVRMSITDYGKLVNH